jgi:CheY-like chemotaxis protein
MFGINELNRITLIPFRKNWQKFRVGGNIKAGPARMTTKPVEILLVEDNAGDVLLVRQALADEQFPINLHIAMDGKQAVQILAERHFHPDLVILDLNVPKISGLSVLECSQSTIPFVVFSSSASAQDRRCAFELGAKDFVQKPTDLEEYGHVVSQIVRHWAFPPANASAS